jgi:hypothetical protein
VTGLDYYGARYYDPAIGVFLSADDVQGNAQGMEPYAYVGGNPETDVDPTGHFLWALAALVIAVPVVAGVLGGLADVAIQGLIEGRTPSWQEYRDGAEEGALIGLASLFVALLLMTTPTPVGPALAGLGISIFVGQVLEGGIIGFVHQLNGEVPKSTSTPKAKPTLKSTPAPKAHSNPKIVFGLKSKPTPKRNPAPRRTYTHEVTRSYSSWMQTFSGYNSYTQSNYSYSDTVYHYTNPIYNYSVFSSSNGDYERSNGRTRMS